MASPTTESNPAEIAETFAQLDTAAPAPESPSLAHEEAGPDATMTVSDSATGPAYPQLPPPPDRKKHELVRSRYKLLQMKYSDVLADKATLAKELEAARAKRDKLQAEADMLVEQMQELAPGISLAPDCVDPDSADEEDQKPFLHGRTEAQKQDGPVP